MFILYDLLAEICGLARGWTSNPMVFASAALLMDFWAKRIGHDFSELNVTGNDISVWYKPVYGFRRTEEKGYAPVDSIRMESTRRYMVTDELGRHIDPRALGLVPALLPYSYRYSWGLTGSKRNTRRLHGPSGGHRVMRLSAPVECELDDGTVIQEPPIRQKAQIDSNDYADYYDASAGKRHSRSWKDQCRTKKQYMRHGRGGVRRRSKNDEIWSRLASDGFPVDARLLDPAA